MAKLLLPKQHYQSLFDAFFAAASVNCNAFLEFRCQNNIIRAKWSDTNKPYSAADANKLNDAVIPAPDVSRPPPPSFYSIVSNSQKDIPELPRKKRRHAIISSSPLKPAAHGETLDDKAPPDRGGHVAKVVNVDVCDEPAHDPPEIVREEGKQIDAENSKISLDNTSDSDDVLEYTRYSCQFETPNRFDILSNMTNDEIPAINDARTVTKRSCLPCKRSHKCFTCTDACEDRCEWTVCPDPITMNCHVCHKSFTNRDFIQSYNKLYGPNWEPLK